MNKMLKSCSRCGRIHDLNHKCYANTKQYYNHDPKVVEFRNSTAWKHKTEEIRQRDMQLCKICLAENIFNYKNLSVHHIVPLAEDWSRRLDNDNLITVCDMHHKDCECGKIPREKQIEILKNGETLNG